MKIRHLTLLSLACYALLHPASVRASTSLWEFDGIITRALSSGPPALGSSYSMQFYLSNPLPAPAGPGLYFPTLQMRFSDGSYGYTAGFSGAGVLVANDQPRSGGGSFDGMLFSLSDQGSGFPSGVRWDGSDTGITLVRNSSGPTAPPLSGTDFPTTLDLNQFSQRTMTLYFNTPGGLEALQGSVDRLYINGVLQVPEPSCLALLVLGGGLAAFASSARKSRSTSLKL